MFYKKETWQISKVFKKTLRYTFLRFLICLNYFGQLGIFKHIGICKILETIVIRTVGTRTVDATSLPHVAESHFITFFLNQQQYSIKDLKYLKKQANTCFKDKIKISEVSLQKRPTTYSEVQFKVKNVFAVLTFIIIIKHYLTTLVLHYQKRLAQSEAQYYFCFLANIFLWSLKFSKENRSSVREKMFCFYCEQACSYCGLTFERTMGS